jgi:hypothetical protein
MTTDQPSESAAGSIAASFDEIAAALGRALEHLEEAVAVLRADEAEVSAAVERFRNATDALAR